MYLYTSPFPHPAFISVVHDVRLKCLCDDSDLWMIWQTLGQLEEDHEMDWHTSPIGCLTAMTYLSCSLVWLTLAGRGGSGQLSISSLYKRNAISYNAVV